MHFIFILAVLGGLAEHPANPTDIRPLPDEILAELAHNEYLYNDIEAVFTAEIKMVEPGIVNGGHLKRTTNHLRLIKQNGKVYYSLKRNSVRMDDHQLGEAERYGFDGRTTRMVHEGLAANLSRGKAKTSEEQKGNPFTVLLSRDFATMPLSRYLKGGDQLREFPQFSDKRVFCEYAGEEKVDGLKCIKIIIHVDFDHRKPIPGWYRELWISPERNYLPVQWRLIDDKMGPSFPQFTARAEDFREIAPGIWHPFLCTINYYDAADFDYFRKYMLSNVQTFRYESVKLDPRYPDEFFRDVKIPDGLPVYVLKDGEIVDSYVQGRVRTPAILKRHWKGLSPFAAVGFACVCLAWLARRRRRNSGRVLSADAPGGSK